MTETIIDLPAGRFTARPYRPEDEQRVLDLWRMAFGRDLDVDLWRWKYADNPFGVRILLCFDPDDEIAVVMYSGVPYRARWNQRQVEIVQLMDIMSHPDYRKTGLFVKAAEVFFDVFAGGRSVLYYGIPGRYHFEIGAKYLHYSELEGGVAYLHGDTDQLAASRTLFGGSVRRLTGPSAELDRVWRDVEAHYPLAAIRDGAFVDWRFFSHPQREYLVYVHRTPIRGRSTGYAVVGLGEESAQLVDIVMAPGRRGIATLVGQVAADLAARQVGKIETWLPRDHFLTDALVDAGWSRKPEPLGIVPTARSFDEGLTIPWVSQNFFYTMADSDLL